MLLYKKKLLLMTFGTTLVCIKTSAACLVTQECTNFERRVAQASNFVIWRLILVGSRNLFHVTLIVSRILRWLLDLWKTSTPRKTMHCNVQ